MRDRTYSDKEKAMSKPNDYSNNYSGTNLAHVMSSLCLLPKMGPHLSLIALEVPTKAHRTTCT